VAKRKPKSTRKKHSKRTKPIEYLLERGTLRDLIEAKHRTLQLRKYHWDFYSELARQREEIKSDIFSTLNESSISNFTFSGWQRAVKWKYGLHPLCALGSLNMPGGRFNVGDVNSNVPSFPALYFASDKDTALQETLGQSADEIEELTAREIALTNPESETIVSVSGNVERVFDLRSALSLRKFVRLIKEFTIPSHIRAEGERLGENPGTVTTAKQLLDILLAKDWSHIPMLHDIPANSQIFGQLIFLSGVDGILYPSKFTKRDCLALFPRNFENSSSFIQLDHEAPDSRVPKRIDSNCWRLSEMTTEEAFSKADLH
jgi:RES domain-containing protein